MSYHPLWSARLDGGERQGEQLGVVQMAPNLIGVPLSSLRDILIVRRPPPTPHASAYPTPKRCYISHEPLLPVDHVITTPQPPGFVFSPKYREANALPSVAN